jgi:predicted patatin/cPLA2 family phospholipase
MEKDPKNKSQQHVAVIKKLNQEVASSARPIYDTIIDGGNVLYSYNGNPNPDDLNTMIQIVRRNGYNPMVVIHTSHTDERRNPSYAPRINAILRDVPHIITPIGLNDDLFILLAYLMRIQKEEQKNGSCISIITRDTYTDHMDKFKRTEKDVSDDFGKYLANDLVPFTNNGGGNMHVHFQPSVSYCIQIVEPSAYIPLEKTKMFRKIGI